MHIEKQQASNAGNVMMCMLLQFLATHLTDTSVLTNFVGPTTCPPIP